MLAFYMTYIEDDRDKDKFVVIYQTYYQSMLKIADSILHDYAQAEDAVHEAFLCILRILKNIKDPLSSQTKALVEKVAAHKSYDICRSRQSAQKRIRPLAETDNGILPDARDIARELEQMDAQTQIKKYLLELPKQDRELLSLYYYARVPAKDIATLLNVSKKTVYNRLHNIMQQLRERMREEDWLD